MSTTLLRLVLAGLAALVLSLPAAAQDHEIVVPAELQDFWKRWLEAKEKPGDEEMDRTVRRYTEDAEFLMNILLSDISRREQNELHHEIRLLAWSLDRVEKTERYISRVRFVLDLNMIARGQRAAALLLWQEAYDAEEEANRLRTASAWGKVLGGYDKAAEAFAAVGDWEYVVFCYVRAAEIQGQRDLRWEQSLYLKKVVEVAPKLPFEEPALENSQRALETLAGLGIDPDKPKPVDEPGAEGADKRGGLGLESYAAGAEEIRVPLVLVNPKKGLPGLSYPSFFTLDQFQLWPYMYMEENGPEDFDNLRGARFQPDGRPWALSRSGLNTFELDRDGDGTSDVSFSVSANPTRVMVPAVGDLPEMAFDFCVPSQRELMFDLEVNYEPNAASARLRFLPAHHYEADVLGETWNLFDLNMDGGIGYAFENYDDTITVYSESDHVNWEEPDGFAVGKAKRALPWSTVVPVGDRWYRTWSEPRSRELRLKELHLATGEVSLDVDLKIAPETLVVRAVDELLEGAYFEIVPERRGKPVSLPVGTYQIVAGRISKGKKTSMDQVRIYTGTSQPFEVREGELTKLPLGAPFKLTFETRAEGEGRAVVGRSIRIFGSGGEEYAMLFDQALLPEVSAQTSEGHKAGKPSTMQKCSIGEWQTNTGQDNILWFPLDQVIDVPSGATWEFKLSLKSHALLGGPLESDWTR